MRWASIWSNKIIHVYCDNTAAVAMLNKGTTRDPTMMSYLRKLFWLSAIFNFRLKAFHIPGRINVLADHISRLHERDHFLALLPHLQHTMSYSVLSLPVLQHMSVPCYYFLIGKFSCCY